jgi:endonuclease/exonuclease/phosphatase family metal-dependent hydrolase
MKIKRSFKNLFFLTINIFSVFLLVVTYAAQYINPSEFWYFGLIAMFYPAIFVINLLFVVVWAFYFRKEAYISLIAILLGFNSLLDNIQFSFSRKIEEKTGIKIMSYNVKNFDLYNWNGQGGNRKNIFRFIMNENPDIICFQEFFDSDREKGFNTVTQLSKELGYPYVHFFVTSTAQNGKDRWGVATFSKFKIVNQASFSFPFAKYNPIIYSDILLHEDTFRLFNVHLASIGLGDKSTLLDPISDENFDEKDLLLAKSIAKKLRKGFKKRVAQIDSLVPLLQNTTLPIILCGDFNDTPSGYVYKQLTQTLHDAFVSKGIGIGNTYNGNYPSFRIDYILHDPDFETHAFYVHQVNYSDHFPIVAIIDRK